MKWILLAAALALPSTASAKVWVDKACNHVVITDGGKRIFYEKQGDGLVTCSIRDWPIARANATIWCGVKNDKVNAEWPDDNTLLWNDIKMSVYTGPLPCPEEAPD